MCPPHGLRRVCSDPRRGSGTFKGAAASVSPPPCRRGTRQVCPSQGPTSRVQPAQGWALVPPRAFYLRVSRPHGCPASTDRTRNRGFLLWPGRGPTGQLELSSQSHHRSPHPPPLQDFETNDELKCKVISFLEEVMHDPELLTQERKAAANIIRYQGSAAGLGRAQPPPPSLRPEAGVRAGPSPRAARLRRGWPVCPSSPPCPRQSLRAARCPRLPPRPQLLTPV